ncbi:MAG: FAD-dependent oxidoreductase [Verrucomicrobiota bacterium]
MDSTLDSIVVGAGISGLMAATKLRAAGQRVCVVEKGRGVGGRMATRRRDGAVFDHGAQFFTVRDSRFRAFVDEWISLGLVVPWYEFGDTGVHYRGAPSMTAVAKHLAGELEVGVLRETLVRSLRRTDDGWEIDCDSGETLSARCVVLTAPVPQSLQLLDAGVVVIEPGARARLEAIRFHKCIAALAILDGPSALTTHGGSLKISEGEPIQWLADNQRKGISPAVPSVTIHSTAAFAEEHWDSPDVDRLPPLLDAAAPLLKAQILSAHGHRWGYSQPMTSFGGDEAFVDRELGLAIAGDGIAGGRVEGAALSGLAAAGLLIGES